MLGRYEPNTRVLIPAMQMTGTILCVCPDMDEELCSVPVYHVRLDRPATLGGDMFDLLHAVESSIRPLPPSVVDAKVGDVLKWQRADGWRMGVVRDVETFSGSTVYKVESWDGTTDFIYADAGFVFPVRRETEGTEALPRWTK